MFLFHALFALMIAVLLTAFFVGLFGRSGPWASAWLFFLVLFFASWAGGLWITPIGPSVWGIYWVPFLFVGVVVALLLAATEPTGRRAREDVVEPQGARQPAAEPPIVAAAVVTTLVWVLLLVLVLPIVIAYAV